MNKRELLEKIDLYEKLMRLDKPIGALLLLWPTLWALWFAAEGHPHPAIVAVFCVGTLLMRSAGCVLNDYADREFDPHVERTRERPLAAGKVGGREALILAAALCLAAFLLILPLNPLVIWLSFPALFLAASYPYTKRFFAVPQAYLGIAFGFGIPMGYAAELNALPWPMRAWPALRLTPFCWPPRRRIRRFRPPPCGCSTPSGPRASRLTCRPPARASSTRCRWPMR